MTSFVLENLQLLIVNEYIASGLQGIVTVLLAFLGWLGIKCEAFFIKLPEDRMTWKGIIRALS